MENWLTNPTHHRWLADQARDLLAFGRATGRPDGGAYWLDDAGQPDPTRPLYTWITTRTVHVYGIGALLGIPGSVPVAERALAGLIGQGAALLDEVDGGWFHAIEDGQPVAVKSCYDHGFVILAGATASHAGLTDGPALYQRATEVFLERFWDDEVGRCVDTWDKAFTELEPYRGLNANMHAVEAMLSAASLTGDQAWLARAARVSRFVVEQGQANRWRLPEHFDADWNPVLDYNRDRPADQFKPYGSTVGHSFEWARLLIHLANAPGGPDAEWREGLSVDDLVEAAERLFERAEGDGWAPDGAPGFVYTVDWDGQPVVRDRLWWVLTEAIAAAAVLYRQTGDTNYQQRYRRWWDHAADHYIEPNGSWVHQLDPDNQPDTTVWAGKSDLYHAFQAALIPVLPRYPMVAAAVAAGQSSDSTNPR